MKSLDIINENLDFDEITLSNNEIKTIKQDLEVLEIIKKKKVSFGSLKFSLYIGETNAEALDIYNAYLEDERHLTLDKFTKLKNWWEANDDE